MLKDYEKVLKVLRKLNDYTLRVYNSCLCDIDKDTYRSVLDKVYFESEFCSQFRLCKKAWAEVDSTDKDNDVVSARHFWKDYIDDVDTARNIDEMSDNDVLNFLNCLTSSQIGDFVIIRYNEIRIFNNIVMVGETFDAYDGLLRECRSFVFNVRSFSVVSLPFYKFMNLNEAADYSSDAVSKRLENASSVEYSNKMDGSFIQISKLDKTSDFYNYPDILTSSKNILDTDIVVLGRKWYESQPDYKRMVMDNPDYTFMFEMIDMNDKHVVFYTKDDCGLYLIGMRHKESGEIVSYHDVVKIAEKYNVRHTEVYDITYSEMQKNLERYKASQKEGYVMNIDGFLVKMKCSDYKSLVSIIRKNNNSNSVIVAISNDSLGELYSILPEEYHEDIKKLAEEVYDYIELITSTVSSLVDYLCTSDIELKQVANWCKDLPKVISGQVSYLYFNRVKNIKNKYEIDYLRTSNVKQYNNYINYEELKRRAKVLKDFDVDLFIKTH